MPKMTFDPGHLSVGSIIEVYGHPFTVKALKRYTRKSDGYRSMVVRWTSQCASCGQAKEFTTGSYCGWFPVRCRACYRDAVKPAEPRKRTPKPKTEGLSFASLADAIRLQTEHQATCTDTKFMSELRHRMNVAIRLGFNAAAVCKAYDKAFNAYADSL